MADDDFVVANPHSHKAPRIECNVFIGAKATILGNITIGKNARIGAGAVVLQDVPRNCTAVGVPARILSPSESTRNL